MKKIFAILLTVAMLAAVALPTAAEGDGGTTVIYFDIGSTTMANVYAYAWENVNSANKNDVWPGVQMTLVEGTIYKTEISAGIDTVIFHDGYTQTDDLTIPTDGNLYSYSTKSWSAYGDFSAGTAYPNKPAGDYAIGVEGDYTYTASGTEGDVISVDIAWDAMSFTYTVGDSTYDPTTHKTTTKEGSWSTVKAGITITNHSNVAIDAGFSFAGAGGIKGSFTKEGIIVESANNAKYQTAGADGVYPAPSDKTEFGIDPTSPAISENGAIGTVTVRIAKSVWALVDTKEAFSAAMKNGGHIKLMNDIDTSSDGYVDFGANTVLDLNGKTLTGTFGTQAGVTEREIKNGTLNLGWTNYLNDNQTLKVSDCTVNGGSADGGTFDLTSENTALILSGTVTLEHGIVVAGGTVTCLAGTYNFDPTAYVDTAAYTVTPNTNGTWTVAAATAAD